MEKIIFHIDVNSAYLSWSALKRLSQGSDVDLRTIPSIVGGDMESRHGVVLAKSIPAKKYGITTGEPIVNALRKCPSLVLESPDHVLYHTRSRELMNFLSDICPEIEQLSVDECFMDFTPIRRNYPSAEAAAEEIKNRIRETFGFTVNIGISDKKVLAKMASDFRKPDLVHTLFSWEIKEKMWPLPVSSLFMCGASSTQALHNLEVNTIGELAQADPQIITAHLKSHGLLLWQYANGIDDSPVISTPAEAKGIGNSTTLPADVLDRENALHCLLTLADSVSGRLRKAGRLAGMVNVEIKYSSFQSVSHQTLLSVPTNTSQTIYLLACRLFDELWDGSPIRLLGIRTSRLTELSEPVQLSLFDLPSAGTSAYEGSLPSAGTSAWEGSLPSAEASAWEGSLSSAGASAWEGSLPSAGISACKSSLPSAGISACESSAPVPSAQKLAALDRTLDAIRQKYGDSAIVRGSFLKKEPPAKR